MNTTTHTHLEHPHADSPHLWAGTFPPPPLADPREPLRVVRSHLNKIDPGKSGGSCRVSFITRLHRRAALQQFWCASFEEAQVYESLAGHPDVVNLKEQLTRVDFEEIGGDVTFTQVDVHVLLRNGEEILVSVKYDKKAKRMSYLAEVANIAGQTPREVADRFVVASRYTFHPVHRACVHNVHVARRGWDPEADDIVLEAANALGKRFTLQNLIDASGLAGRGRRAAIRLIGDGDIGKHLLDPFAPETLLRMPAA